MRTDDREFVDLAVTVIVNYCNFLSVFSVSSAASTLPTFATTALAASSDRPSKDLYFK